MQAQSSAQNYKMLPEAKAYMNKHKIYITAEIVAKALIEAAIQHSQEQHDDVGGGAASVYDPCQIAIDTLQVESDRENPTTHIDPPSHESVVRDQKDTIVKYQIAVLMEEWMRCLLDARADNPMQWSIAFFEEKKKQQGATATAGSNGDKK